MGQGIASYHFLDTGGLGWRRAEEIATSGQITEQVGYLDGRARRTPFVALAHAGAVSKFDAGSRIRIRSSSGADNAGDGRHAGQRFTAKP